MKPSVPGTAVCVSPHEIVSRQGAGVAPLTEPRDLGFSSGTDLAVVGPSPTLGSAFSAESASDTLSTLSLSLK